MTGRRARCQRAAFERGGKARVGQPAVQEKSARQRKNLRGDGRQTRAQADGVGNKSAEFIPVERRVKIGRKTQAAGGVEEGEAENQVLFHFQIRLMCRLCAVSQSYSLHTLYT